MTIFSPHGTLDIAIDNNLILIEAQGPWNIEYLDHLHAQLIVAVSKVDLDNYAILITPKGEAISVEGAVLNGSVNIISTDNWACNGVVHAIDAVLLPPSLAPAETTVPATTVPAPTTLPATELPETGTETTVMLLLASILLLGGYAMLRVRRNPA